MWSFSNYSTSSSSSSSLLLLLLLLIGNFIHTIESYSAVALEDEITNLPGTEALTITFRQFSGYLKFPGSGTNNNKYVHYWFVESEIDPANAPVVVWSNGGPGCSGMIGMMTEQGPFRPNKDGTLSFNKYAWNTVANMVFIESPVSVGFSYSDNKNDYKTGDGQTAIDNYQTIQAFMQKFPDFLDNDLYIASESYGGHYIPTLAKVIVDQNAMKPSLNPVLNFKGFAIGNPYTNLYSGTPAMIDTFWGHQLISMPLYEEYQAFCAPTAATSSEMSAECDHVFDKIFTAFGSINPYALNFPVCTEGMSLLTSSSSGSKGMTRRRQSVAQSSRLLNFLQNGQSRLVGNNDSKWTKRTLAARSLRALVGLSQDYNPCEVS